MKNRKIFFSIVSLLMIFVLTGCFSKSAISTSDFKAKAEDSGLTVVDATSQFSSVGQITEATIAGKSNEWQVEFYVLEDESAATSMFNTNKTTFESYKSSGSSEATKNVGNYSTYSLTSDGYYMHLCKVDNTLLYARVSEEYKDSAKEFIKKIGYE